jgi:hypothetical protein
MLFFSIPVLFSNNRAKIRMWAGCRPGKSRQLAVLRLSPRLHVNGEGINNSAGIPGNCDPGAVFVNSV